MTELTKCLVADSFAAPPAHILEGLDEALRHREFAGVPHPIYQELWHIAFWQQLSLDWTRCCGSLPGRARLQAAGLPGRGGKAP